MVEIEEKHLRLLDYILPKLSNEYFDHGNSLGDLVHKFKKEQEIEFIFSLDDEKQFLNLYNYTYFEYVDGTADFIEIDTEYKSIIDKYGSLSRYLNEQNSNILQQQNKETQKELLEIELAKSNIEANKLNKITADRNAKNKTGNTIATWLNVAIGLVNIAIIIWQLTKTE